MEWQYEGDDYIPETIDPKVHYGFVYEITNLANGKKYIGKKLFWSTKYFQKNLKRKRKKVESDWRSYYGSSELLTEDVKHLGNERFSRTILRLCATRSECSYFEAKYQFDRNVLTDQNYYNRWIMVKVRRAHLTKII
jgi:hypothetical protein